jgi:RHS repeat-associated protein
LPELIQFKNGCQIKHTYSAGEQKLSSRYITVNAGVYQPLNQGQVIENLDVNENDNVTVDGMDYIGNIEYQIYRYFDWDVTFEPAELKYIFRVHNPEGFATNATTTNGPIYSYYRKDHLGNNREVWRASYTWGSTAHPAATVQRTQYYPSGLPWKYNIGDNPGSQPYKYGGKKFVEMHGLDEYDSDARWYYPAIMRTTTPDPLAEKYYDISPYAWCGNNPVKFVDPDGRFVLPAIPIIIEGVIYVSTAIAAAYYGTKTVKEIKQIVNEKRVDKAKVVDSHGIREEKRRNDRSLREDVKIRKKHDKMVETGAPSPQSDGSSDPKRPIGDWRIRTIIGVTMAINLYDNIVNPKLPKPKPDKPKEKPKPPRIIDVKPEKNEKKIIY